MPVHVIQNAFNAGELSRYVSARSELEVYQAGARTCRNFIVMAYGGARYRPGLEFIARTKDDGAARLVAFEFSTSDRHVLEFGDEYLRIHACGLSGYGPVLSGGTPVEVVTPWTADELRSLQFAQLNDIVIICHPDHPVKRLSRFSSTSWVLEDYPFENPPFLDVNEDEADAITASAVSGTVTLTATADVWTAANVGSVYELAYRRTQAEIMQSLLIQTGSVSISVIRGRGASPSSETVANASTTFLRVDGEFLIQTFGTWEATVEVHRRALGATDWNDFLFFESTVDRNVNETFTLDEPSELRLVVKGYVSATFKSRAVISVTDPFIRGRARVTGYTNARSVTAVVERRLATGGSTEWSESAFSTRRGFPRAVVFHGGRLWFGGTSHKPELVWGSRIQGFDDFARPFGTSETADADAPMAIPVVADEQSAVQWLSSARALLVGTSSGEFVIEGGTQSGAEISPEDHTVRRHTSNGSEPIMPLVMDAATMFVQRQGRRLRKLSWVYEEDAYLSDELSIYGEHLTRSGIVEIAFQRQRDPVIWGITGNGGLVGWTYRPKQPFLAGHRHDTPGGTFESVACAYGDADEDEVWLVVNRDGMRCIERMRPDQMAAQENGDLDALFFLDGARIYGAETETCDGLDHLEGLEVMVFADDAFAGIATVDGGEIENPVPDATRVVVGLHYRGELETMDLEPGAENGTSQVRMKSAGRGAIRLFQSLGGEWFTSQAPDKAAPFLSLGPDDSLAIARPLSDVEKVVESYPGATRALSIGVRQTQPYPMTVLAVVVRMNMKEDA